ncbi:MAG: YcxB family protein [Chitinophagales bacterium]
MIIQFQYTPALLQRAHELHYKKFFPLQGRLLLFLGLLSAWAGLLLLLVKGGGINLWFSIPLIVYGIVAITSNFFMTKTIGKRTYKKLADYHDPMTIEIDDEKISISIRDAVNEIPWSNFTKALITDEMILLYPSDKVFFIFPKKNFSGDEYAGFCELVKTKIEKTF